MAAEIKVTARVLFPACAAKYDQPLFRRPGGLYLPPSRCGSCAAPWPQIIEIRLMEVAQ